MAEYSHNSRLHGGRSHTPFELMFGHPTKTHIDTPETSSITANNRINYIDVRVANSKAGIKPTAPLSAFDKENSMEFPLDSVHYLYKQSNPNPAPFIPRFLMSQLALARPLLQFKRKEKEKKNNIQN